MAQTMPNRSFHSSYVSAVIVAINAVVIGHLFSSWDRLRSEQEEIAREANVTAAASPRMLLFNRVPKAGTTDFVRAIGESAAANDFSLLTYRIANNVDSVIATMGPM